MKAVKKNRICDLNDQLTCKICRGYFIDATTIVECLHTFCRSCIVKYLETNKYCPVCEVQVHKTKPLLSIKRDKTIQDVVYKLVPRLFQNEMQRRREFYERHPEAKPSAVEQSAEAQYQQILAPEEHISLTLNYFGRHVSPRYLRCPAAVSIGHLHRLIRAKYDLGAAHRVEVLYGQDCLSPTLTLMDVAYIYMWKRKCPIDLSYRIYECKAPKPKPDDADNKDAGQNNNTWREVQLRISENGEMSITGIHDDLLEMVEGDKKVEDKPVEEKTALETITEVKEVAVEVKEKPEVKKEQPAPKKELPGLKYIGKAPLPTTSGCDSPTIRILQNVAIMSMTSESATVISPAVAPISTATTTTVFSTINATKCSTKSDDVKKDVASVPVKKDVASVPVKKDVAGVVGGEKTANGAKEIEGVVKASPESTPINNNVIERKRKSDASQEGEPKPKQIILNHSIGLLNLSNNHPLKRHSLTNRNGEADPKPPPPDEETASATPNNTKPNQPCYMPKNSSYTTAVLNVPRPTAKSEVRAPKAVVVPAVPVKAAAKPKQGAPIGYKTLRDPPKSWNSQISKANLSKPTHDGKYADLKNVRPAKFFKMRNNIPRYLGNPASGVKPMYQVHVSPDKDKNTVEAPKQQEKTGGSEIKRHSIVKIDPKTLKPISEKAPDDTSLSNTKSQCETRGVALESKPAAVADVKPPQNDLKINTSSVSIFNPLKNHSSSPKADRKSPKSPGVVQNSVKTVVNSKPKSSLSPAVVSRLDPPSSTTTTSSSSPSSGAFQKTGAVTVSSHHHAKRGFTPPNPFIPNLASPTLNPNQFLFAGGHHPGLPPYDPRIMAAYHSLWYGQRMAFGGAAMAGLTLDLNQRKASVSDQSQTSPKVGLPHVTASSQQLMSPKPQQRTGSPSATSLSLKKPQKDGVKTEKSLHTAVEKLVQNRTKEIVRNNEMLSKSAALKDDATSTAEGPSKGDNRAKDAATKRPPSSDSDKNARADDTGQKRCSEGSGDGGGK